MKTIKHVKHDCISYMGLGDEVYYFPKGNTWVWKTERFGRVFRCNITHCMFCGKLLPIRRNQ